MAKEVEKYIPHDPHLLKLWPSLSGPVTVHTSPEGAEIYIRPYKQNSGVWEYLGRTPIEKKRLPFGFFRWKAEKPGFVPVESAFFGAFEDDLHEITFQMFAKNVAIPGMVYVKGGSFSLQIPGFEGHPEVDLGNYWIDKSEVTNLEFKAFVQAGGYTNPKFWKQKFLRNGRKLSWKQAIAAFRDKTNRPGPSTWEFGDYPAHQGDYPATGLSWYEAAAYAEFVGKSLPTVYHWTKPAAPWNAAYLVPASNFSGHGAAPVRSFRGLGPSGTYDMAGNAREWCSNAKGTDRYLMGGSWKDPAYIFTDGDAASPFDRSPKNGIRLVKYLVFTVKTGDRFN